MRRQLLPGLLAGFASLCGITGHSTAASPPLRVQKAEVIDHQGFGQPLVALTMMVPAGWQTQGTVTWRQELGCGKPVQRRLLSRAPDGLSALELLPGESWGVSSTGALSPGCPTARFEGAQAYLQAWVQRHRPGARWLDYRPLPERSQPATQQAWPGGGQLRSGVETGQALIAYQQGGRDLRETLAVSVNIAHFNMPGLAGMPPLQSMAGESFGVLAMRAPAGQLDLRQFDALWLTLRTGAEWQQRLTAGMNQIAQDNAATQARIGQIHAETSRQTLAEQARRGQILAQSRADIADIHQATQRQRDATNERLHKQTVKTLREVEHYREPGGSTVELPSHYRQAWKLKDGSYLLTDDVNFRPARDLGVDGDLLKRVP
jgi:hypothetical protein